jgi:HEAT repeat protein
MKIAAALALAAALIAAPARAQVPDLSAIAAFEDGQDRKPLVDFQTFVSESLASPSRLKQIEQRLLQLVQSQATRAGKDFALRQLSVIGTAASVDVLTRMLGDKEQGEMARYALARIPGPESGAALRRSLPRLSGDMKIAIVNSLGQRRDAQAVPALSALVRGADARLAEPAAFALARIANRPALAALAAARRKPDPQPFLNEAYLLCAGQMAADGERAHAIPAYRELLASGAPETIRVRALNGFAGAAGKDAVPVLTAALESKAPRMQAAAIRALNLMAGDGISGIFTGAYPKLEPTAQVRVLTALAARDAAAARPLLTAAANHPSAQVRVAALEALAVAGDPSSLALLAETAANREGAEQTAARESLYRLRGEPIDAALVSALSAASGKVQTELILGAGERGTRAAVGALLAIAANGDRDSRRAALRSLRNVAGPDHVPPVLALVTKASESADRREAARTLAVLMRDAEPARARLVLEACQAASAVEVRTALLEVMGQAPSDEALPLLRTSLQDFNPEIVRAAVLALSEWNTPAPMLDLLEIARSSANPTLQVVALRGYIKLVSLHAGRTAADSARMLIEAMRLATRPEEKRSVLALLPGFPCQESLDLANQYRNDPDLGKEAGVAADRLAAALKSR